MSQSWSTNRARYLLECTEKGGFGRMDISNCTFKGDPRPVRNRVRPLLSDLDTLPQTPVAARIWGLQNYRSCLSRQNRITQASGAGGCKCR